MYSVCSSHLNVLWELFGRQVLPMHRLIEPSKLEIKLLESYLLNIFTMTVEHVLLLNFAQTLCDIKQILPPNTTWNPGPNIYCGQSSNRCGSDSFWCNQVITVTTSCNDVTEWFTQSYLKREGFEDRASILHCVTWGLCIYILASTQPFTVKNAMIARLF